MIGILKGIKHLRAFLNPRAVFASCRLKIFLQRMMADVNAGSRREGYYAMKVTSLSKNAFTQSS